MEEGNLYKAPTANLSTSEGYFDKLYASKVASAQRVVIYSLLAQILSIVIGMVVQVLLTASISSAGSEGSVESEFAIVLLSYIIGLVFIVSSIVLFFAMVVFAFYVYHFLFVILLVLFMFIPVINLLVFLIVNIRANMILRAAGYHVGFLGARSMDN